MDKAVPNGFHHSTHCTSNALSKKASNLRAFAKNQQARRRTEESKTHWKLNYVTLQDKCDAVVGQLREYSIMASQEVLSELNKELEKILHNCRTFEKTQLAEAAEFIARCKHDPKNVEILTQELRNKISRQMKVAEDQRLQLERDLKCSLASPGVADSQFPPTSLGDISKSNSDRRALSDTVLADNMQTMLDYFESKQKLWKTALKELQSDPRRGLLNTDHMRLLIHLEKMYGTHSPTKDVLANRIHAVMPQFSIESIMRFLDWLTERRLRQSEGKALAADFEAKLAHYVKEERQKLDSTITDLEHASDTLKKSTKLKIEQSARHHVLKALRRRNEVQQQQRRLHQLQTEKQEFLRNREQQRKQRLHDARLKQKIRRHKDTLLRKQEEVKKEEEEADRHDVITQKLERLYNAKRVAFRKQKHCARKQFEEERKLLRLKQDTLRERRLSKLRSLHCWKSVRDNSRATGDTSASHSRRTCELTHPSPFLPMNSFSAETLTEDLRFRIHEALIQHGLHTSEFATQALQASGRVSRK